MDAHDPGPPPDDTRPPDALPPAERYVVEEQLAAGGQGVVFRGRDRQSAQAVIIKQLAPDQLANPQSVARFIREAEALSQLNHPNIVRMLAAFEHEGRHAIVMEYVPGGTLRQLLDRQGLLSIPQLLDIALELADALARAHHLGILHRDVKPENVLLTETGAPCLTDFGAALLRSKDASDARLTRTGTTVGSPAYMSPEALYGEELDTCSDVWSFGVLLYEMIAGRRPFEGDTATHVIIKILQEPVPSLSQLRRNLPPALVSLVEAMLVKQRAHRLSSMRQVASSLEAIRAGRAPTPEALPTATPAPALQSPSASLTPPTIARHLPGSATPFIGRDQELREIATRLAEPELRLLTIMGPGGIGKTQLALQAARTMSLAFPDGVFFVPLAPLSSATEIVFAIAQSLNVHFYQPAEATTQLYDYLHRKELLLILDNFEHVIDGAELVADIVEVAPRVTLLVTSRASLNLSFQHLYTLGGLKFPEEEITEERVATEESAESEKLAEYPAIQLLLQQIRLVRPGFHAASNDLSPAEQEAAARITRLVQGMPLALILAARWAELLPLSEIADEISRSLDFLDTTLRDLPPRQRSMRAVFDYSWHQLSPEVQEQFARLSVFRGGFTREAATRVANANLRALRELVRKSFVTVGRQDRYEVHELLRQFGEEQLEASGQAQDVRDAHSAFFLDFLNRREADLKGRRQVAASREIESDFQNTRRAWNWALRSQERDGINDALESLHLFCDIRGRHLEGIELFARARQALAPAPGHEPDRIWSRIALRHSFLQILLPADHEKVLEELEHGLAAAQKSADPYEIALATHALGAFATIVQQDYVRGEELSRRARDLFEELGDPFFLARALVNIGLCAGGGSDLTAFPGYLEEAVRVARDAGDIVDVALALANLTEFAVGMGQYSTARNYCTEAITLAREIGSTPVTAYCQSWLAFIDLLHGRLDEAASTLKQSLSLAIDIQSQTATAYACGLSALAAAIRGDHETGRRLGQESRDNPFNNTLGLVFSPWALAIAWHGLGHKDAARAALRNALEQAQTLLFPAAKLWLLPVAALFLAEEDQPQRAAELLALAASRPLNLQGWRSTWAPMRNLDARLEDRLGSEIYQESVERGRSHDVSAVVTELVEYFS